MEVEFEWDKHKNEFNQKKYGISFEEAKSCFEEEHGERGWRSLPDSYWFIFEWLRPVQTQIDHALEITLGSQRPPFGVLGWE